MSIQETDPLIPIRSRSASISRSPSFDQLTTLCDEQWGATPGLRKQWATKDIANVAKPATFDASLQHYIERESKSWLASAAEHFPGLLIALILNLFLSISFGNAFFPRRWEFPPDIPASIGVSMFLFSTFISQIILTFLSDFPVAIGMMMVENIPFMHTIALNAIDVQGMGKEAFATVFTAYALSSITVGVMFFILGYLKLGSSVYFIPRHCIIGCIGGIGIFIFQTGLEVSTDISLNMSSLFKVYFTSPTVYRWLLPFFLDVILRLFLKLRPISMLPPFFFICIPLMFYLSIYCLNVPLSTVHENGWFFDKTPPANSFLIWELFDFTLVNWFVIWKSVPTIAALTIFSLMHAPINIPSLTISTGFVVDMDKEMINHGYSNLISGCFGGLQNYLCYSNSLLYYKCKGGGKISGCILCLATLFFFVKGPSIVEHVPRCMAGCLLLHVGVDLTTEALVDTYGTFDFYEYSTIVIITLIMTGFGMTAGLAFCVICATLTFTLQESNFITPIRGVMSARTLRSSKWRSPAAVELLERKMKYVTVFQLQGTLFFGNISKISHAVAACIHANSAQIECIILDFTLVVSIDSSAADTISKIIGTCTQNSVRLVYCRGSSEGFPTMFPLTETIKHSSTVESRIDVHDGNICMVDSLDDALCWCEDMIISVTVPARSLSYYDVTQIQKAKQHLWQLFCLAPDCNIDKLMTYFAMKSVPKDVILWKQGDVPRSAVLVVSGELTSSLEEEAGTTEVITVGSLVGEYALITGSTRLSTMVATEDTQVLELTHDAYERMVKNEPQLALILSKLCVGLLGRRVQRVSNRIWESHCLPV